MVSVLDLPQKEMKVKVKSDHRSKFSNVSIGGLFLWAQVCVRRSVFLLDLDTFICGNIEMSISS